MKTRWCFSTVMLFMLYMMAMAFGIALSEIIRDIREGQTDLRPWFLAPVALFLSWLLITRRATKE